MTTVENDVAPILASPTPLTLVSGLEVSVERLRTRQMMKMLRILTRGAGGALADLRFDGEEADFVGQLVATVVFSIPEAEDEAVEFVQSLVSPAGLIRGSNLSKAEKEINVDLEERLRAEMDNPDLDDLVSVIEHVVTVEGPHLAALGKRLAALLKMQQQAQAAKKPKASSAKISKD